MLDFLLIQVIVMSRDVELHSEDVSSSIPPGAGDREVIKSDPRDHVFDGLPVVVAHGQYKSYHGIIKDTNPFNKTAWVELEAGQKVRTLKIADLMDLQ
jgi:transcription elongation factor